MTTKLNDLRVAKHRGWYDSTWTEYERATAQDLVAAVIAEGGEIVETHWETSVPTKHPSLHVDEPGRYLVYPIPADET